MNKEEKELLLKELCARAPYGVKVHIKGEYKNPHIIHSIHIEDKIIGYFKGFHYDEESIDNIKPYLRPISSMTEEECKTLGNIPATLENRLIEVLPNIPYYIEVAVPDQIDWLNENMFDYRGLIDKGLALEASEGMYNIKEK